MKQPLTNKQKEYIIFKNELSLNFYIPKYILIKNALRFFCLHNLSLGDRICGDYFPFTLVAGGDLICYNAEWFGWIMHALILDECYAHSSKFKQ